MAGAGAFSARVAANSPEIPNAVRDHFSGVLRNLLAHAGVADVGDQFTEASAQIVNDSMHIYFTMILYEFVDRLTNGAMAAIVMIMCFTHNPFSVSPNMRWR